MKMGVRLGILALVALAALLVLRWGRGEETSAVAEAPVVAVALPRLVDLGSTTCIPCKRMAPILAELAEEQSGRLEVEVIDVREQPEAAARHDIRLIPTQIFFAADGRELWRHEGFIPKADILAKWAELGVTLAPVEASAP
ncbi:MAG: thioredoxin family protein [Candidatus Krumholzibacteriia bacterium]